MKIRGRNNAERERDVEDIKLDVTFWRLDGHEGWSLPSLPAYSNLLQHEVHGGWVA